MTLQEVVQDYLNEAELPQHKLYRLQKIAISGLQNLHMDVSGLPTTVSLDFDANTLTSPLPSDYITYRRIGYESRGIVIPFAQNPRIKLYPANGGCMPPNENKEALTINSIVGNPVGYGNYPYWGGYGVSTLAPNGMYGGFSSLGGDKAYICDFRIDEQNGMIQFGCNPRVEIIMEYLANPSMANGEYQIHPFDVESLKCWLTWKDTNSKNISSATRDYNKREYYRERGEARKRHYQLTMSTAYQKVRQTFKASPQF